MVFLNILKNKRLAKLAEIRCSLYSQSPSTSWLLQTVVLELAISWLSVRGIAAHTKNLHSQRIATGDLISNKAYGEVGW